jgi:hypothetical protein
MAEPAKSPNDGGVFKSDCVYVWIDGPADRTVRPIPPGPRLEQAKALRAKIYGSPEPGPKPPTEEGPADPSAPV